MTKFLTAFIFIVLGFAAISAQEKKANMTEPDQTLTLKTEMLKLDQMIGKWSGAGWIQQGPKRDDFVGTENVQRKLDGLAVLIEGKFTDKNDSSKVIHETLAVLNFNPKTSIFDFKTYLANGRTGDFTLRAKETYYEWGMDFPGSKILYIITIKDGVWNEIGKMSRDDGKTWFQFFEMNLKKM
ncbi:MAG: hypothetical protein ABI686_11340 [Acidobacteriota bacterium]